MQVIARILWWAGLVLQLGIGLYPLPFLGLLAPAWGLVLLIGVWLGGTVGVLLLRTRRPRLAVLVPAATIAAWVGVLVVGDALLGWTA